MNGWSVCKFFEYGARFQKHLREIELSADLPAKQELIGVWCNWWDAVWSHWMEQPDFEDRYVVKYLSDFLRELPTAFHPHQWFAQQRSMLRTEDWDLLPDVLEHREPGQGEASWYLGVAMGLQILDCKSSTLKKDASWALLNEWSVANEACIKHISHRRLTDLEKQGLRDFAKFCSQNLHRYAFSIYRDATSQSIASWRIGEINPFASSLRHVHLNGDLAASWVVALLNNEIELFVELASDLDYPPILSIVLNSNHCIGNTNYVSAILIHAPCISHEKYWSNHSLGAQILHVALEKTYEQQACIYGDDFFNLSNELDGMTIALWEKWIDIVLKRRDGQLLICILLQCLMDDVELQVARIVGKNHVALQLLDLIDVQTTNKTLPPSPLLDSFHRGDYRQALSHCYLMASKNDFSIEDDIAIHHIIKNIHHTPSAISWGDVFAAQSFLKVDNPKGTWSRIWSAYELEREVKWWQGTEAQTSGSLGCLWLGVVALRCYDVSKSMLYCGSERGQFSALLWEKIWFYYLSGSRHTQNFENVVAFFLMNEIEMVASSTTPEAASLSGYLNQLALDSSIWNALLTKLDSKIASSQWLLRHLKTSEPEVYESMHTWTKFENANKSLEFQKHRVFQNFLNYA